MANVFRFFRLQREWLQRDVDRERRLRLDTEARLKGTSSEADRCRVKLSTLQKDFTKWVSFICIIIIIISIAVIVLIFPDDRPSPPLHSVYRGDSTLYSKLSSKSESRRTSNWQSLWPL